MIVYQSENSSKPYNCDIIYYDDFSYIAHLHNDLELIFVSQGEIEMTVENQSTLVKENEFALILPNQIHSYRTVSESSKVLVAVFAKDYVPEFYHTIVKKTAGSNLFRMCERDRDFFLQKIYLAQSPPPNRLWLSICFSLACAVFLSTAVLIESEHESKSKLLLHRMLGYVSEHYRENITLDDMARALGYERHYISRCFHEHLSKNFKQFVNEYRINYAKHLITTASGQMSMTEIANSNDNSDEMLLYQLLQIKMGFLVKIIVFPIEKLVLEPVLTDILSEL